MNAVAWQPNGNQIATGGSDGTVRVWDATTGNTTYVYKRHKGSVNAVAWSPDGQQIASGSNDGTVQVWNADTGERLFPPISFTNGSSKTSPVTNIAWSPDDKYIAFARQDGSVVVFLAAFGDQDGYPITFKPTLQPPPWLPPRVLAWYPNGDLLAFVRTTTDSAKYYVDVVEIWSIVDENSLIGAKSYSHFATYQPFGINVRSMAWSPNGKLIVTAEDAQEGYSGTVDVWVVLQANNSSSIQVPISFEHTQVASLAWSPNSKCIAMGSGFFGAVEVWNLDTHKIIDYYTGNTSYVGALAWSPDGTRIVSASSNYGIVNVWKVSQENACSA